jgi:hypothetical protein
MPETDNWLTDYGECHRDIRFPGMYWVSTLLLVVGTVGVLWSLPIPEEFARISPVITWGSTFLMAAVVYYFIISMPLAIGMLPFVFAIAILHLWLVESRYSQSWFSLVAVACGVASLLIEHRGRGGLRAVLRDIQLMMIAPAWLLSVIYRRLGIPY